MKYFGIYRVNSSYLLTYVRRIRGIAEGNSEVYLVEKDEELILEKAKEVAFDLLREKRSE